MPRKKRGTKITFYSLLEWKKVYVPSSVSAQDEEELSNDPKSLGDALARLSIERIRNKRDGKTTIAHTI